MSCVFLAAMAACSVASSPALRDTDAFLEKYDIRMAYFTIEDARKTNPDDTEIERRYWEVRKLYLLHQAQKEIFHSQELTGLAILQKVLALDPDSVTARAWIEKAKMKLANRAVRRGRDHQKADQLILALESFDLALEYVPEFPAAVTGKVELADVWSARRGKAEDQYLDGVRALALQEYRRTHYHMNIALVANPALSKAVPPRDLAFRRRAEQRFDQAKEWADDGHFMPALSEFQALLPLMPGRAEDLRERIAHLEREAKAESLMIEGENAVFRGEFGKAQEILEKAFELSQANRTKISEVMLFVTERELEHRYILAQDVEFQGDIEAALELYRGIDSDRIPNLGSAKFGDLKARIGDLASTVEEAGRSFTAGEKAEKAKDIDGAIEHYQDALDVYPGYRDLQVRIQGLKAAKTPDK